MEGVLSAVVCLFVCKLACSALFCPPVAHTITAVGLCSWCLLLCTDFAIILFLLYARYAEAWVAPFPVSSDVIALRFLIFLCQTYGAVLLLIPALIGVELLVEQLCLYEKKTVEKDTETGDGESDVNSQSLSKTVGFLSCLLAWIVSGIYGSYNWILGQLSVENCLEEGGCLVSCFLSVQSHTMVEFSWFLPGMVLLLSLTGSLGLLRTKLARRSSDSSENILTATQANRKDSAAPKITQTQQTTLDRTANLASNASQSPAVEKTPYSCSVHRAGFVYKEQRWLCPYGNAVLCPFQTGLADNYIQEQKQSSYKMFLNSTPLELMSLDLDTMKHCVYTRPDQVERRALHPYRKQFRHPERESPCLGEEIFTGLIFSVLVCVLPTVLSCNILLIRKLETLVVYTVKLLSSSVKCLLPKTVNT